MNTKIFCDIAELDQIKKFNKKKIVKGFTTNPSLMRKAGAKDYKSYSKKILNQLSSSTKRYGFLKFDEVIQKFIDLIDSSIKNRHRYSIEFWSRPRSFD